MKISAREMGLLRLVVLPFYFQSTEVEKAQNPDSVSFSRLKQLCFANAGIEKAQGLEYNEGKGR
jgi:hypothetical protein